MRLLADLGAGFEIVIDRLVKGLTQILHALCMKAYAINDTGDLAEEDTVFVIIFDAGRIALVAHHIAHGTIPNRIR